MFHFGVIGALAVGAAGVLGIAPVIRNGAGFFSWTKPSQVLHPSVPLLPNTQRQCVPLTPDNSSSVNLFARRNVDLAVAS